MKSKLWILHSHCWCYCFHIQHCKKSTWGFSGV